VDLEVRRRDVDELARAGRIAARCHFSGVGHPPVFCLSETHPSASAGLSSGLAVFSPWAFA
jgi:hypothetical protein